MLHGQGQDLLTGLLFTGHNNTADTMVFTGKNPHVLTGIWKERENVIKLKQPGERLTWEECKAMSFTQDVITETLRLCNVCTTTFQKSLEDVHVRGKLVIPKGWIVLPYFTLVHYDPTFYPKPYKFNPWHYKEAGTKLPFFGFGGARLCPGSKLARTEICILHHLVTKFDYWEFIGKDIPSFFPFPRLSE
jgi:cytochrome P450